MKWQCILEFIKSTFSFSLPIGWNELGVIATVLAVIVALYANRKATKQLKSALEIQEQSKNIGLFEQRIELAQKIQSGYTVSELALHVLFSEEIVKHYKAWRNCITEKLYAEHDLETFFSACRAEDLEGGYINTVQETIEKYELDMSRDGCSPQVAKEYETYCNEHTIWEKTGENGESTAYNYLEISKRLAKAVDGGKKEKEITVQLVEKFISDSIKSIGVKPKSTFKLRWKKDKQK